MKKLLKFYGQFKGLTAICLLGVLLSSTVSLLHPIITKHLVESIETGTINVTGLLIVLVIFVGLMLIDFVGKYCSTTIGSDLVDLIKHKLSEEIFDHYQKLSFRYFDNERSGSILHMMNVYVGNLDRLIYYLPTFVVSSIIQVIGMFYIMSRINLTVILFEIPLIVLTIILIISSRKRLNDAGNAVQDESTKIFNDLEDALKGVRTVQSFSNEEKESLKLKNGYSGLRKLLHQKWVTMTERDIILTGFVTLFDIVLYIGGGYMAILGKMSVSDILLILMYSYMITQPVSEFSHLYKIIQEGFISYNKINEFLATEPEILNHEDSLKSGIVTGNIEFNNVSFKYNDNNEVLSNIDFRVDAGSLTAIVGPSGAGKSTIASLIPRYYDINDGSITIDGINVKDYDFQYLRKSIGFVMQETYLFYGTVAANIAYGKQDATMDEIIEAAKLANAHEFISQLPNGYHTNIGERGLKLSGGQRQRLAIARIFLINPTILIMDEATSDLDNESERMIQLAFEKLAKNRTTIVIAHRLSTIENANNIIYLDKDGISEEGTHEELMNLDGKYAKLYKPKKKKVVNLDAKRKEGCY